MFELIFFPLNLNENYASELLNPHFRGDLDPDPLKILDTTGVAGFDLWDLTFKWIPGPRTLGQNLP